MLVALASVVVDHIQQYLQTGRVQGPYRHLELGDLPVGPAGPRRGRLATAGGPLPRIRPLRPPSTLTPLGKYPPARPRRRDVATPEGQAGGRCLNLLAALRLSRPAQPDTRPHRPGRPWCPAPGPLDTESQAPARSRTPRPAVAPPCRQLRPGGSAARHAICGQLGPRPRPGPAARRDQHARGLLWIITGQPCGCPTAYNPLARANPGGSVRRGSGLSAVPQLRTQIGSIWPHCHLGSRGRRSIGAAEQLARLDPRATAGAGYPPHADAPGSSVGQP
jgi:hypothetical protein